MMVMSPPRAVKRRLVAGYRQRDHPGAFRPFLGALDLEELVVREVSDGDVIASFLQ